MKKIVYYKVRIEGVDVPSRVIMNKACFEKIEDAINYIEDGWKKWSVANYLKNMGREIIHEYKRQNIFGYYHQIVIKSESGFTTIVVLAVDKCGLIIR